MNDSRMNVSLATTAAVKGAALANYVEVVELLKVSWIQKKKKFICEFNNNNMNAWYFYPKLNFN